MRVAILYASAGHGHKRAAEALKEAFQLLPNPPKVELFDVLELSSFFIQKTYVQSYYLLVAYMPKVWEFFFHLFDRLWVAKLLRPIRRLSNRFNMAQLQFWMQRERPDVVICTHFMAPEILGALKRKGLVHTKSVTVVTDFGVHSFWINRGTDYYIVMSDEAKAEVKKWHVRDEKIKTFGIPIFQKFSRPFEPCEVRKRLGLDEHLFTVLLTSGSFGLGPIQELIAQVEQLGKPLQVIVVCGKNMKLYNALTTQTFKVPVKVFGYVENMEELMAASHVAIAKPGGLTCCESLAQELILILSSPIPGQETGNREFLLRNEAALSLDDVSEVNPLLKQLMMDPQRVERLKANIRRLKRPNASRDIASWVMGLV